MAKRALNHFAHIAAFKADRKATLAAAAIAATTLDIGAEAIPGEAKPLSDDEFETLMSAHLEGDEGALDMLTVYDGEVEDGDELGNGNNVPFIERYHAVSDELRLQFVHEVADRIDDRIARADEKSVKNLERARAKMATGRVARVLAAAGLPDASFANRVYHEGKEFNVYAFLKLADLAKGLAGESIENAVNVAVVKSMFALQRAGIPFDFDTAKAAASSGHTPQRPGVRSHLTRHTVAAGTATTQAGSTLHALCALGIVSLGRGKNYAVTILENATTEALRGARFIEGGAEA